MPLLARRSAGMPLDQGGMGIRGRLTTLAHSSADRKKARGLFSLSLLSDLLAGGALCGGSGGTDTASVTCFRSHGGELNLARVDDSGLPTGNARLAC